MADSSFTIRIPKWLAGVTASAVIAGGAFFAGTMVSDGGSSPVVDSSSSSSSTTTSTVAETTTTVVATSTTAKPAAASGGGNSEPAKLAVTLTISDNCPAAGIVPGEITVRWTVTKAVSSELKVVHGSSTLFWGAPGSAKGSKTFATTCNNRKVVGPGGGLVNDGGTLVYFAMLSATGADGQMVNSSKESAA